MQGSQKTCSSVLADVGTQMDRADAADDIGGNCLMSLGLTFWAYWSIRLI
jgi:hypothetical protein